MSKDYESSWFNAELVDELTGGLKVTDMGAAENPLSAVGIDPGGRRRGSQITTLFDGKTLDVDDLRIWQNVGTGTFNFNVNKMEMSVTAGQYCIRRGEYKTPYASGKPHLVEFTADNLDVDAGVKKMVGYYSSAPASPYDTVYDGFWLENDGGSISIKAQRNGVETMNIPFASWKNYNLISDYDWSNFTVGFFDFLWLGGTGLRLFIKTDAGFILAHEEPWAGNAQDTFISSPNHSVRYELRSTTGTGELNAICSQVATEGAIEQIGKSCTLPSTAAVPTNTVGTIYALKGIKARTDRKNIPVKISNASIVNTTGNDFGVVLVYRNPVLSAALSYSDYGNVQHGIGDGSQTVTSGDIIAATPADSTGAVEGLENNFLSFIGIDIDDNPDEYVLAYMPTSSNQSVRAIFGGKEF